MDNGKEIDIDLREIFNMMRSKIIYIILITILSGVIAGCFTQFFIQNNYTASIKMHVNSDTQQINTEGSISYSEYTASTALVNTYLVVLNSDTVLDKVAAQLNMEGGASSIRKYITASQMSESIVFMVSVTTPDPAKSQAIANAIADVAPDEIVRIIKAGSATVIDYAKLPTKPSSPNIKQNILVGLIVGFIFSFVFFFVKEAINTTISTVKDLEREFEIPVLGTIPRLIPVNNRATDSSTKGSLEPPAASEKGGPQ